MSNQRARCTGLTIILILGSATLALGHSTQACLNSEAAKSAVSVAVADCEAKAQAQLDAKDVEIARLQTELNAMKIALPCARIVYNPEDLKLALQQSGPICIMVDTVKTCTADYCDGYWQPDVKARYRTPIKKGR